MIKIVYQALLICLLIFSGYAQSDNTNESFIARVGNSFISEQEFLERYELLPGQYRNRRNNVEESKLVFLYSMIAEKLLAQEALDHHLNQNPGYNLAMEDITKMLARDELYREEVAGKVEVKKTEIQKALPNARRQLSISFLYFDDSTDVAFVRKQLKRCEKFDKLKIDSSIACIRDSVTLKWGEAEAPIEEAGFRLKKGECSPVIKASTGYYILHLNYESPNNFFIGMQPDVLYERVGTKLRLRKEQARLDEYIQNVLHSKVGFSLPHPFKIVAQTLNSVWKNSPPSSEQMITDSLLVVMEDRCRSILNDSMVVVDSSCWTVRDVLFKLRGKIFKIDSTRMTGVAAMLNSQIRILVQQELLAREAISRHLEQQGSAKKELDILASTSALKI